MANEQLGRLLLLKRNTVQDGSGSFQNACGLQERAYSLQNNLVERVQAVCDTPEDPLVRTVSAGVQTQQFTGTLIFHAEDRMKAMLDDARLQRAWTYQVVWPGYGTFTGLYMVSVNGNGPLEGDLTFEATVDPTAVPTFAAA